MSPLAKMAGQPWLSAWNKAAATVTIAASWLVVRLAMTVVVDPVISGDQTAYVAAAREFVATDGAVLARRSPGYVLFLASTLWLGPHATYAAQSLITLAAAILTQRRLGFWQGLAHAACPFFVIWEWALLTETLCLNALWSGWLLLFSKRPWTSFAGALLVGIAILSRPLLMLLPLFVAPLVVLRLSKRGAFASMAVMYLPVALALSQASGPSYFGVNLWIGTWERDPHWLEGPHTSWPEEAQLTASERNLPLLTAAQNDAPYIEAAKVRYETRPLSSLGSWFARYPYLWIGTRTASVSLEPHAPGWLAYKGSMWILNMSVLLLGCAGAFLALRRRDRERSLLLPIAYVAIIYVPFHNTETRYSVIALPFLLALGIYFCGGLLGGRRNPRHRAVGALPDAPAT